MVQPLSLSFGIILLNLEEFMLEHLFQIHLTLNWEDETLNQKYVN